MILSLCMACIQERLIKARVRYEQLPGKNTQKVNKQKIRCKNQGIRIGCSMS